MEYIVKKTIEVIYTIEADTESAAINLANTMELDVIALCCDVTEDKPLSIALGYRIDLSAIDLADDPAIRALVLDHLQDHTTVVGETSDSILFVNY